jgi:putative DNA primase/helicase
MTADGFKSATTDPDKIRDWWTKYPDANIGVRTGPESGIWVLDVDGEKGIKDLDALQLKYGPLPPTPVVETGGGGRHYYFLWPRS